MKFIRKFINSRNKPKLSIYLQSILGFKPKNIKLYEEAFTHSSMNLKDHNGNSYNYERLEFIGDAMLSAIIAVYLFNTVPKGNEGYLTKMRSKIVSREHLNKLGEELNLIAFVRSNLSKNKFGSNIHGNLFESLIGAIYMDKGFNACVKFIQKTIIVPHVDISLLENKIISYKSLLIEWCQKEKKDFQYKASTNNKKENSDSITIKLIIDGELIAKGKGLSKKKTEEKISKIAYYKLNNNVII